MQPALPGSRLSVSFAQCEIWNHVSALTSVIRSMTFAVSGSSTGFLFQTSFGRAQVVSPYRAAVLEGPLGREETG